MFSLLLVIHSFIRLQGLGANHVHWTSSLKMSMQNIQLVYAAPFQILGGVQHL